MFYSTLYRGNTLPDVWVVLESGRIEARLPVDGYGAVTMETASQPFLDLIAAQLG